MNIGENPLTKIEKTQEKLSPQEKQQLQKTSDVIRKTIASVIQTTLATQRFGKEQQKQVDKIRNALVFDINRRGGEALAFTKGLIGKTNKEIQNEVFTYLKTNYAELFGLQGEKLYSRKELGLTPGYKEKQATKPISQEQYEATVATLVQHVNNPQLRTKIQETLLAPREYKMRRTLDPSETLIISIKRKINAMLKKHLEKLENTQKDKSTESLKQKRPAREVLEEARQKQMAQTRQDIKAGSGALRAASENRAKIQEEIKAQEKLQFLKEKPSIWKRLFSR